jgi:hypothetical protein
MLVSCCVRKPPFLETCLVTIANVATCHELVCWCVSDVTMPRATDEDIHCWHTGFVLALNVSCRGSSLTHDQDWLPVTELATLNMPSKIWLWQVSGWHVAEMSMTFPTKLICLPVMPLPVTQYIYPNTCASRRVIPGPQLSWILPTRTLLALLLLCVIILFSRT